MSGRIVEAGAADREAVVALWHAVGLTRPWNDPDADFNLACRGETSAILLARDGEGELAGTVMVGFDGHRGWVYYLGVREEWRGQGVARALMAACEAWLIARGCPKVQLMVRGDNRAALGFYDAIGYAAQDVVTLGRRLDGA
ncbi:acetyltransferase (GNAT) family protein [Novosphingobium sp. PhB165]|uniref:GNAT family acetyltransferase n=1 Tax=Novosphingobium sp. PhB165 TaxID=2485105 RepID=UPI0010CEEF24|nr:GNAT family acetyltransferase [Novosphingobium sp. PhB165]TCM17138.1 acetyltransferase (GNAT) family protein [Novosphingobium sp. PhB165]